MSRRPWMPLYTADYHRDTRHLSVAEHGAYLLLIMEYWDKGGLPQDEKQIMRVACCEHQEWEVIRNAIIPFFDGNWKHKRIEQELKKYEQRAAGNRQKAVKAAQKRWHNHSSGNTSGNAPSIPPGNAPQHAREMPTQKSDLRSSFGSTSEQLAPSVALLAHEAQTRPIPKLTGSESGSLATAPLGGALRSPLSQERPEEATEKESKPLVQLSRAEYDAMLVKRRLVS